MLLFTEATFQTVQLIMLQVITSLFQIHKIGHFKMIYDFFITAKVI